MRRLIWVGLALTVSVMMFAGCSSGNASSEKLRKQAIKTRTHTFSRAQHQVPVPNVQNFPLRKTLAEMTVRESMLNHPWYVYLLGMNGNAVAYYVAKTVPINACDFMSSTEDVHYDENGGNFITTAPSLDGIYYGGSGSASGCDAWVFLDQATNALIQIRGVNFYTADKPLRVDAKAIRVRR